MYLAHAAFVSSFQQMHVTEVVLPAFCPRVRAEVAHYSNVVQVGVARTECHLGYANSRNGNRLDDVHRRPVTVVPDIAVAEDLASTRRICRWHGRAVTRRGSIAGAVVAPKG